jgi:hypothetical protein
MGGIEDMGRLRRLHSAISAGRPPAPSGIEQAGDRR